MSILYKDVPVKVFGKDGKFRGTVLSKEEYLALTADELRQALEVATQKHIVRTDESPVVIRYPDGSLSLLGLRVKSLTCDPRYASEFWRDNWSN